MTRSRTRTARSTLSAALLALALAGCSGGDPETGAGEVAAPVGEAEIDGNTPGAAAGAQPAPAAQPGFDIAAVPVSEAALGEFPYFTLPEGYGNPNKPLPVRDFDRVALWTGDRLEWVEGRIFESYVHADAGKGWSRLEVVRNLDHQVRQAGGVKVTESKPPQAVIDAWDRQQAHSDGRGDIYNAQVATWLVRRPDRNVWLHFVGDTASGSWMVVESAPFQATAELIPADELSQQLDVAGRAVVQVNFATDQAEILPDSRPQLEQIAELLEQDPALRLSVDGHTDSTGDAARNQQLSESRAAAVVAALAERGIEPGRLQAQGFGASQPVADNATEAGKARNRRVELVKR